MVDAVNIRRSTSDADKSGVTVIINVPHAINYVPPELLHLVDESKLDTHEGFDPGVAGLADTLWQQVDGQRNAVMISSGISRLVTDHNRAPAFCTPPRISSDVRNELITTFHKPYIDAVDSEIELAVTAGQIALGIHVHTYEPELDHYKRRLFSISGDARSAPVQVLRRHLKAILEKPEIIEQLRDLRLNKPKEYLDSLNKPFDLGPFLSRSVYLDEKIYRAGAKNPFQERNMAMRFSLRTPHPWVHLETRNDFAHTAIAKQITAMLYQAVLADPEIAKEWRQIQAAKMFGKETDAEPLDPRTTWRPLPRGKMPGWD